MSYAAKTKVPVEKSKVDIENLLVKYGADQIMTMHSTDKSGVQFTMNNRQMRFVINLPQEQNYRYTTDYNQATRSLWRGLLLCIKSKLVAVESEISTFEEEFMAYTVLPDGLTVAEFMGPQIEVAYRTGQVPKMLSFMGEHKRIS